MADFAKMNLENTYSICGMSVYLLHVLGKLPVQDLVKSSIAEYSHKQYAKYR